jgi:Helicase HerA, central domain
MAGSGGPGALTSRTMADLTLGALVDPATHQRTENLVKLASGDFTTHGVIVGMTGSGKTGLGVVLIEECLSAGVPALLIDPKGDLTNLCLTFPGLSPAEFRPWVNDGDAAKAGVSVDEFAAQQAKTWTDGLAGWGIGPERIAALRKSVDFTIYTPGSTAGVPVNIVGSLQAPADVSDLETMRDEIEGYVSGLLGLVGIEADPLSSREHILLSNLIETSWAAGKSLDLATLVGQVQSPPIRKLGVFELDAFFPPNDRMGLAMRLNGLLASPSFAAWAAGPPADIDSMLRTADGRPRCAIVTTAHLSDEERQFVTALLLSKLVTWMRKQSGTTDLRALLYMDEVAGYVPPSAMPPTKKPIMTLMKQARAFGVGVVLSTQNPIDVDYKALSNAGTWMIGRLQTERDKARLLDGMSAAAGGVDVQAVSDTISGLAKREFVLRRAGKDKPEVFTTRWAMSYLRGPLTRDQIETLTPQQSAPDPFGSALRSTTVPATMATPTAGAAAPAPPAAAAPAAPAGPVLGADETTLMPKTADGVAVRWVDPASPWLASVGGSAHGTRFEPAVVARVRLRYDDDKAALVTDEEYEAVIFPLDAAPDATRAIGVDYDDRDLRPEAPSGAVYRLTDAPIDAKQFFTRIERDLIDHLVRSRTMEIQANRDLKLFSRPGETAEAFGLRCDQAADDLGDAETAKLRDKYGDKVTKIRDQIAMAEDRVDIAKEERKGRRSEELLSTAGSILGGLLGGGRRKGVGGMLGKLGGIAGRRSRTSTSGERVDAAENKVELLENQLMELEEELADELLAIDAGWVAKARNITSTSVTLERTDVSVAQLVLAWVPC